MTKKTQIENIKYQIRQLEIQKERGFTRNNSVQASFGDLNEGKTIDIPIETAEEPVGEIYNFRKTASRLKPYNRKKNSHYLEEDTIQTQKNGSDDRIVIDPGESMTQEVLEAIVESQTKTYNSGDDMEMNEPSYDNDTVALESKEISVVGKVQVTEPSLTMKIEVNKSSDQISLDVPFKQPEKRMSLFATLFQNKNGAFGSQWRRLTQIEKKNRGNTANQTSTPLDMVIDSLRPTENRSKG